MVEWKNKPDQSSPMDAATFNAAFAERVPFWAPTTAYTLGQQVVSPGNDVVSAVAAHTSGASFTPANWTLSSTYAPTETTRTTQPGQLLNVTLATQTLSTPIASDWHGGYFWGGVANKLWRSVDGITWAEMNATIAGDAQRILPAADGEMLAHMGGVIRKSTGWAANPATATWAVVATMSATAAATRFQFDSDPTGQRFISGEYGAPNGTPVKVRMSLNAGATWTVVWDATLVWPTNYLTTHLHAVCYDKWTDRWWFTYAHDMSSTGLYYSENNGATWTRMVEPVKMGSTPTTMNATEAGIVCGSDSTEGAVFVIRRHTDPTKMRWETIGHWRGATGAGGGIPGFTTQASRDSVTGIVYLIFNATGGDATLPVEVWASDGHTAERIYSHYTGVGDNAFTIVANGGRVLGSYNVAGVYKVFTADAATRWAREVVNDDGHLNGNGATIITSTAVGSTDLLTASATVLVGDRAAMGGTDSGVGVGRKAVTNNNAVAVGTVATAALSSVAVGATATAASEGIAVGRSSTAAIQSVAVGRSAAAGASISVAVGYNANAASAGSVAIGSSAACTVDNNGIAIGNGAATTVFGATAIGPTAVAAGHESIAIGSGANVNGAGARGIAIGPGAQAWQNEAVAIGRDVQATAAFQVAVGARHFEMLEIAADPAAGATNAGRFYMKDNGLGKTQFCVRFPTGAVVILATEP